MVSESLIKIISDTIPEALQKLSQKIKEYKKQDRKEAKNIFILIKNPDIRHLPTSKSKEIIRKYYEEAMENREFKDKLCIAVRKLKEKSKEKTMIPLNLVFKQSNLGICLKLKRQKNKILPTLFYAICKGIKELKQQIAFTQILQEDLSIGLGLKPSSIKISIALLHIHNN